MSGHFATTLIVAAGAVLALGTGFLAWSSEGRERARESLRAKVEAVEAREQPWPGRREALWGETRPGRAFEHYQRAAGLQGWLSAWWDGARQQVVEGREVASAERIAGLRRGWTPALHLLQQGAHCDDARPPAACGDPFAGLHQALKIEVPLRFAEGRAANAVRLWLDGLAFAVDQLAPWAWREQAVRRLLDLGSPDVVAALGGDELDLLAQGLGRLDPLLARMPDYEVALAARARGLLDGTDEGVHRGYYLGAWESGFDLETQQFDTLAELLDLGSLLSPAAADGAARQRQWRAWASAVRRHDNWYGRWLDPLLVAIETQQRQVLTQLRLLRLAVAFHRGGEPLELPDPFAAGMLHVQVDLGTATFRSAETFWGCERRAVRR